MNRMNDIWIILTIAVCTFLTRLLPFVLFGKTHEPPRIIKYLGQVLPASVIAVLIIYCLKSVDFTQTATYAPASISIALIILLHIWKRNMLLSIGLGTISYMLLLQFVFC
ncbi:MAG: branched-chain amino acid transporter permease [Saccharofermentanales bacterium]